MTEQDRDAEIGRVLREKKQAEHDLEVMASRARKLGETLAQLGAMLQQQPQHVVFENVSTNIKYARPNAPLFKVAEISGQQIADLTSQLRDQMEKVEGLREQASRLGF
jgi:hypothetical protein